MRGVCFPAEYLSRKRGRGERGEGGVHGLCTHLTRSGCIDAAWEWYLSSAGKYSLQTRSLLMCSKQCTELVCACVHRGMSGAHSCLQPSCIVSVLFCGNTNKPSFDGTAGVNTAGRSPHLRRKLLLYTWYVVNYYYFKLYIEHTPTEPQKVRQSACTGAFCRLHQLSYVN